MLTASSDDRAADHTNRFKFVAHLSSETFKLKKEVRDEFEAQKRSMMPCVFRFCEPPSIWPDETIT